jgi:hypothetical protein
MQSEIPEWAAYIGVVVRLIASEPHSEPDRISSLLREIDASEAAMRHEGGFELAAKILKD